MTQQKRRLLVVTICLGWAAWTSPHWVSAGAFQEDAQRPDFTDQQLEFFENKVRPLLVEHCYECHGPEAAPLEGSLSLASRKAIVAGGDSGPAIVPGHADDSLMIEAIRYEGVYEMPPDTKMSDGDIEILSEWVNQGAPWPRDSDMEVVTKEEFNVDKLKAEHWAWKPVSKRKPPTIDDPRWSKHPIDAFVRAKLTEVGLEPASPADRRTLIRRVYFDLIGLPPTPGQVEAFVADTSPDAFAKVVDQLLASPQFGERWTRHWMDLARYAETFGHEFDYPIPYPHQYRDYLIRAFNADLPYDQLIEEHLAGDLLPDPRLNPEQEFDESRLATGFWFFHEAKHGAVDSRGDEAASFDNQIDVVSKSFLGLTVACARCHDHKFDAIGTDDYYALVGFLQSSRRERMMLDPGRKIRTALAAADKQAASMQSLVDDLAGRLGQLDADRLSQYLKSAHEVALLMGTPQGAVTLQGEALKQRAVSAGTTEVQTIKARGAFRWEEDKQFWWRDAKPGQTWELEFDVPAAEDPSLEYSLNALFTRAQDYGAAEISLDGKVIAERVDFYAPQLSVRAESWGDVRLKPGKHQLTLKIVKANPKSIKRHMVGLDSLQLVPVSDAPHESQQRARDLARQFGLEAELVQRLATAMADPSAAQSGHPLELMHAAVVAKRAWNEEAAQSLANTLAQRRQRTVDFAASTELFADFSDGLPEGWSSTGFAFTSGPSGSLRAVAAGDPIQGAGTIHSGALGKEFQGALRSPDFDLQHKQIHYRVRGHNVVVRVIINGFFMDEYNALLFNGCKITLPQYTDFTWHTQAGDLQHHLGNRCYIEILDQGDGWVELEEVRFSDGVSVPSGDSLFGSDEVAHSKSLEQLNQLSVDRLQDVLSEPKHPAFSDLANWLIREDLTGLISPTSDVGVRNGGGSRQRSLTALREQLLTGQKKLRELASQAPSPMMAVGMIDGTPQNEHVFIRGSHKNLGPEVPRRFLSAISKSPIEPPGASGRLQLARRITAPNNPLTSRVAVNRVWHHLLGVGIVPTVDNFGVLGKPPTHPELLDYLAAEFVADDWSIKRLIRRIVLSETYRMSSQVNPAARDIDPDNQWLHRARIRRLQGEAIRDTILALSGRLDLTMYGPSVPIHLTSFMGGRGRPGKSGPLDGNGRRSVYMEVRRNFLSPMMLAFDTPTPFATTGRRNQSNVPAQALILMNSPLVIQQAQLWADRLIEQGLPAEQRIEQVYLRALSRPATDAERQRALEFLHGQAQELGIQPNDIEGNRELWRDFCHVIFNVKEFIFIQ